MKNLRWKRAYLALAVIFTLSPCGLRIAAAAELKIPTAGAFKPVVLAPAPEFEKQGHTLVVQNDTVGALIAALARSAAEAALKDKGMERADR